MSELVRQLCETFDDPHAFATAYASHVEDARASGRAPLSVTEAALEFHRGRL